MKIKNLTLSLFVTVVIGMAAAVQQHSVRAEETTEKKKTKVTKVSLDQVPAAARKTIEKELAGGELEDIAVKTKKGRTVYETDIIRDGHKWEVNVAEDGEIVSKIDEGEGKAAKKKSKKDDGAKEKPAN